jgi:hypothetical protein
MSVTAESTSGSGDAIFGINQITAECGSADASNDVCVEKTNDSVTNDIVDHSFT